MPLPVIVSHSFVGGHIAYLLLRLWLFTAYWHSEHLAVICIAVVCFSAVLHSIVTYLIQSTSCGYLDSLLLSTIMNINVHFLQLVLWSEITGSYVGKGWLKQILPNSFVEWFTSSLTSSVRQLNLLYMFIDSWFCHCKKNSQCMVCQLNYCNFLHLVFNQF